MSFKKIQAIPTAEEIIDKVPMTQALIKMKQQRDKEISDIFLNKSDKFLVIVGPCSADDVKAVTDYTIRLSKIQEKVKDKLYIIPRVYTNKPRTNGDGYKGMLHQPDPQKTANMLDGILTIRKMHINIMQESGFTAADEMLYPENLLFVEDLLSYIAVGARSTENQGHRLVASGIDMPVGLKNPMSGGISVMFNSIYASQSNHTFIYNNYEIETTGNNLAHGILRGSVNKHGESLQNYHYEDLLFACNMYLKKNLANPFLIVDTNHSNSKKNYKEQPRIAKEVLNSRKNNSTIKSIVKGLLIESYLEDGSQSIDDNIYGKSITDACLGIKETEKLLYYLAEHV